jgi:hypothetical protein
MTDHQTDQTPFHGRGRGVVFWGKRLSVFGYLADLWASPTWFFQIKKESRLFSLKKFVPVDRDDVCVRRSVRVPARAAVGAGAPLPVGSGNDGVGRSGRTPGGVTVGAGARLPMEYVRVHTRRSGRTPGGDAVDAGE